MVTQNGEIDPAVELAATQLAEEIAQTHAAIMGVHKFASEGADPILQLNCMKAAARMMLAQASAALSLQRLKEGNRHTYTFEHRSLPPTPKNWKTNVPETPDA